VYFDYFNVFVFLVTGILFVFLNMVLGGLLRPHKPTPEKLSPYECGEEVIGDSWIRFDIRFYTTALIYLIFAVEIAFLFPWAVVFRELGLLAYVEGFLFVAILFLGLVYVWAKGDLDWVKVYGGSARGGSEVENEGSKVGNEGSEVEREVKPEMEPAAGTRR
jgi:NADH-quinone oxidoreductase subunit A